MDGVPSVRHQKPTLGQLLSEVARLTKVNCKLTAAVNEIATFGTASRSGEAATAVDHRLKQWGRRVLREVGVKKGWSN